MQSFPHKRSLKHLGSLHGRDKLSDERGEQSYGPVV
jgi:hypothetical protein